MRDYTTLQLVWFILIGVLWTGYLVLEGFDFGVGMLIRTLAKDDVEKRMIIHSIGPLWDGNEVWLLVAGGATFAAFPEWYATLFSGFYLALFLILVGLIIRGVSFEFWGKDESPRWRATWEWAMIVGSAVPALLWGVAWANIINGVPINAQRDYTGNLLDLLGPYALLGGVATLTLFLAHGAIFLSLRTNGDVRERAGSFARTITPVAAVAITAFLAWTLINQSNGGGIEPFAALCATGAAALVIAATVFARRRPGIAFGLTAGTIALYVVTVFADLFPHVMVSSTAAVNSMTINEAASTSYTLTVMTVVAVALVPVVLMYQGWTYWVFRARLSREDFESIPMPFGIGSPGNEDTKTPGSPGPRAPEGTTPGSPDST